MRRVSVMDHYAISKWRGYFGRALEHRALRAATKGVYKHGPGAAV